MGNAGRYSRKNGDRDSLRSDSEGGIPALGWASMSGIIAATLFLEYVMSWILFFSPGWANGWPFGVRFQSVLSAAATGWISIMLMTLAAGVGALVGFVCALLGIGKTHGRRAYRFWLRLAVVVIICLSVWVFRWISASVWEAFPDGYMPH